MALRSTPSNNITSNGGTITGNTNFPNGINVYSEVIGNNTGGSTKYYKLARVRFVVDYNRALFNIKLYHTGSNLKIANIKGYFNNDAIKRSIHSSSFLMVINNSGSTGFAAGDISYVPLDSGSDVNDYIIDVYLKVGGYAKLYENTESAAFENGALLTIKPDGSTLISSLPVAGTTTTIDSVVYTYGSSVNGVITSDLNSQTATTQNAIPKFADTAGQLVGSQKLSINASDQLVSTVTTSTAPFVVGSTTMVSNLNADRVDDLHGTDIMTKAIGTKFKIYNQIVAEYDPNLASVTGTIKVTLPKSWSSTMLYLNINGYNHVTNLSGWTTRVGGYNFSTSTIWQNTTASSPSSLPFNSVRFAHDGNKCCILLGTTSTVWIHPKITIDNVFVSFNSFATGWETGYSIDLITDETGITTSATPTINAGVPIALTTSGQFLANNNIPIQARETGGTARNILNLNASNAVQVGATTNATTINSTPTGLMHNNGTTTLNIVTEVTGTAAPAVTPNFAGQIYVDTTNKKSYSAIGSTNSADWLPLVSNLDSIMQTAIVATTGNITLSGLQTIDGYTTVAGDRVLVKDQSTGSQNGLYVAASGSWSRTTDIIISHTIFNVERGTLNRDTIFMVTTDAPITIGTTALTIVPFGKPISVISLSGTAAPAVTPAFVGQQFVDTTNKKIYVATGTTNSSDWTILN